MAGDATNLERCSALLRRWGVEPKVSEELLRYNESAFVAPQEGLPTSYPLEDGPQVLAWQEYLESAGRLGAFEALRERLVQLRFPIVEGISRRRAYLSATRRGQEPGADIEELRLEAPQLLSLELHLSAVGRVPVLTAGTRGDFVTLLCALAHRNEPVPVADSQGASLITGLNNWDRVRRYRREWEAGAGSRSSEWPAEMARMAAHRELYQDRIVLLSRGPYSDVPAEAVGMGPQEWLDVSLVLRREHECAHLFTKHVFASARNNLMDELIADYAGIVAAVGSFRADWFLLFLGIAEGGHRGQGRLLNYLGVPPLSEAAQGVLCRIVERAAANLENFDRRRGECLRGLEGTARMIVALSGLTLVELAGDDGERLLEEGLSER